MSLEEAMNLKGKTPTFKHTFERYFLGAQQYILEPMFFASIGFAIPFRDLWTPKAIWQGIVYTILMLIGKVVCGLLIPFAVVIKQRLSPRGRSRGRRRRGEKGSSSGGRGGIRPSRREITMREGFQDGLWPGLLLGFAMVARGEIGLLIIQIGLNNTDRKSVV